MDPILQTEDFNPEKIANGLYVTAANAPAYPTFTAMKIVGDAKLAGVSFEPDGTEVVAFKVGGGGSSGRQVAQNPRMQMSNRWLQNAILDYSDWNVKWWRECVQNSVDAKGRNVRLYAFKNEDGTHTTGCDDDGTGMSMEILLDKFLVMGATTKEGGKDTSGGFGKAKEMLILPWMSWQIHTQNVAAVGVGDAYTVYVVQGGQWVWHQLKGEHEPEFPAPSLPAKVRSGTSLSVVMPSEKYTTIAHAISYVELCNIPGVRFKFESNYPDTNETTSASLKNGDFIRDVDGKVNIYFKKSKNASPRIIYRTREGLCMFTDYLSSSVKGYITIELTGPSIEILTSNRDGIRDWNLRNQINKFQSEITTDSEKSLRAKKNLITEIYRGEKFKANDQKAAEADMVMAVGEMIAGSKKGDSIYEIDDRAKSDILSIIGQLEKHSEQAEGEIQFRPNSECADIIVNQEFSNREASEVVAKQLVWKPSFVVQNDVEDFRVPTKFKPEGMTPAILRLAKVWTEMCRFVLTQLGCKKEWGVGYYFSDEARAACLSIGPEQWLVLNPFKNDKQEIYNPSNEADRNFLYAVAIHEATHLHDDISMHDTAFARALTVNMALCTNGAKKIKRLVDSIHLRGQAEFTQKKGASKFTQADDDLLEELGVTQKRTQIELDVMRIILKEIKKLYPAFDEGAIDVTPDGFKQMSDGTWKVYLKMYAPWNLKGDDLSFDEKEAIYAEAKDAVSRYGHKIQLRDGHYE